MFDSVEPRFSAEHVSPAVPREAFDLIEELKQFSTAGEVFAATYKVFHGSFGVDNLLCAGLNTDPAYPSGRPVLARGLPEAFLSTYERESFLRHDPIARMARRSPQPFAWDRSSWERDPNPRAHEVMQCSEDFGICRGVVVPIHGPQGAEAVFSMTGAQIESSSRDWPAIRLIGYYAYDHLRHLLKTEKKEERPNLTPRELEVLLWVAQGKSAWEIGEILNISKRTVDEHTQTAARKLGAVNRAQAIAIALRNHIFDF